MVIIETLLQLMLGLAYMAILGYPVLKLTLPDDLYKEYGYVLLCPVGYLMLCMAAFILSGSLDMPAPMATMVISSVLATGAMGIFLWQRQPFVSIVAKLRRGVIENVVLVAPMMIIMLWPLLINGIDTYLGAVNPDYFAGLVDNYYLLGGHSVAEFTRNSNTFYPLDYLAGSISSSGRFASGLFPIAIENLIGLETRSALTLSIALFLCCLPLTIYFFSRVVFGFTTQTSKLSSWLIAISAPVGLSYLYFYLGQNSGMAALPLVLSVGFLLLTRPSLKLLILFSLLANALLVVYLGMLPYAVAPLGALAIYLLFSGQLQLKALLSLITGFLLVTIAVNIGMLSSLGAMVMGWSNVIGQTLQGQYFLDFLTEMFFPLYLGVTVYPIQSSWYFAQVGALAFPFAFLLTLFSGGFILYSMKRWVAETNNRERIVVVLSAVFIYVVVWAIYTFQRQYGYAVFKMASWLQFILVPFAAYGLTILWAKKNAFLTGWKRKVILASAAIFVLTNLISIMEYGYKGLGHDLARGYIVNNFDMSGNRDYFELSDAVKKHTRKDESVGVSVVDSIQNFWVSYYLKDTPMSILSHENIPGDDENLPDIFTNQVTDYYGNVKESNNVFFHGAEDDYYLIWNDSHANKDIAIPSFTTQPIWQNKTFRLYRAADNPDMIFTGRGFYRVEYNARQSLFKASFSKDKLLRVSYNLENKPYWWPERMRWTAQGGEVYLLRPSSPGSPYTITFDAVVGFEHEKDSRTVELWANKIKFDEFEITSAARYISKPFFPKEPVTKIVIKVREKVGNVKRKLPVWNKDIPIDYRQLNLLLSNIRVAKQESAPLDPITTTKCKSELVGDEILDCALWFNGIQIDRWVGKYADFGIRNELGNAASLLRIEGFMPGNLNFDFPMKIAIRINDTKTTQIVTQPGDFVLNVPMAIGGTGNVIDVRIEPKQHAELKDEFNQRRKIVSQSLRLNAVSIK